MAKGYWVARVDVTNPEQFRKYAEFVGPFVEAHSARFLVRGGQHVVKEGAARARTVVVEFASYDAALTAYESDEYKVGLDLRRDAGIVNLIVIEGVDD